ncbi:MAG: YgiT-type zinc finger protein [Chloroflexota bacterium]|nr:MAG: YgiT-type zinc finger protein [Chloroflexota bacterium]
MKCTLRDCSGEYQERRVSQVFTRDGQSFVVEGIPAMVCDVCGDTILNWSTVDRLLRAIEVRPEPEKFLPVYLFDKEVA